MLKLHGKSLTSEQDDLINWGAASVVWRRLRHNRVCYVQFCPINDLIPPCPKESPRRIGTRLRYLQRLGHLSLE